MILCIVLWILVDTIRWTISPNSKRYEPHATAVFKQRYFFDSSYYKPGGPVYLYIGGETGGQGGQGGAVMTCFVTRTESRLLK